jgi:hypothetical protein
MSCAGPEGPCKFSNLVSLAHFRVTSGVILAKYVEALALISSDGV